MNSNRIFKGMSAALVGAAMTVALPGVASAGYKATESGTENCPGSFDVYTRVRADGAHAHTIAHSTSYYSDLGYVRNTYKYSGSSSAAFTISGGYDGGSNGYYDYATSDAYCQS